MTDTTTKKRTITLTGRPPIKITDEQWPAIASARWNDCDNQYEFQANRKWNAWVKVRQHADGRTIVYGGYDYDTAIQHEANQQYRDGIFLDTPPVDSVAICDAIADVTATLGTRSQQNDHFADICAECIADLPAVEL